MDMRINNHAVLGCFGSFWAENICGMPPKQGNALSENKNPRFWDYPQPYSVLWHAPKTGKCTFRK